VQGVRKVEGSSTLEGVWRFVARSASRSFLKDSKLWESFEGFEPTRGSKEEQVVCALE
jgi:hypothetical protein